MKIVVDDLSGPEIAAFLAEHLRQMHEITPLENAYALDLDALRRPDITFWTAVDGSTLVGCAALKRLDATHAELKSMRTAPARTRTGVASRILEHVLTEARTHGYRRISLETGTAEYFLPARRLYEKFGFDYCAPFGDYQPSEHNTFMTRVL
jgi:putative acetyltransferase